MRDVKKQRGPSSGKIGNNENTVNIEKIVPPVPARKIKVPALNKAMNEVAVTSISNVPRKKRV